MVAAHNVHGHFAQRDGFGWGEDAKELKRFFLEYEATVGFSSTFSAMLAAEAGVSFGSGAPTNWDPYAKIVHKISEGKRTYRTLKRMDESGDRASVVVLYRLYGPRNGSTERADFGKDAVAEYATLLVAYTDAAEAAREDLVLRESSVREEQTASRVAKSRRNAADELEEMFWSEAALAQKLRFELAELRQRDDLDRSDRLRAIDDELAVTLAATGPLASRGARRRLNSHARRLRLERDRLSVAPERETRITERLAAGRQLMKQVIDALGYDGTLRARLGTIESTDREITVEDAVRAVMDASTWELHAETLQAWKEARLMFVTDVRIEANEMRRRAHEAFRVAKTGLR